MGYHRDLHFVSLLSTLKMGRSTDCLQATPGYMVTSQSFGIENERQNLSEDLSLPAESSNAQSGLAEEGYTQHILAWQLDDVFNQPGLWMESLHVALSDGEPIFPAADENHHTTSMDLAGVVSPDTQLPLIPDFESLFDMNFAIPSTTTVEGTPQQTFSASTVPASAGGFSAWQAHTALTANEGPQLQTEPQVPAPPPVQRATTNAKSCPHCPRTFTRPYELKKHIDRHSKPHACSVCSRRFGSLADMERHRRARHDKTGAFVCGEPGCRRAAPGAGFERREHLLAHAKRKKHAVPEAARRKGAVEAASGTGAVVLCDGLVAVSGSDGEGRSSVGGQSEVERLRVEVEELKAESEKMKVRWEAERTILMQEIERRTK